MSGHMYNPYNQMLSATFEITAKSSATLDSPRASFTDPVPPAISVIKIKENYLTYNFFIFSEIDIYYKKIDPRKSKSNQDYFDCKIGLLDKDYKQVELVSTL